MGTQATYPFITRTALRGLVASILGLEALPDAVRCGIRLLSPVQTVVQEMTMHGKDWVKGGEGKSFHRPTAIELVVNPRYRIYYSGPLSGELEERLRCGQSHYHTYLGSAYCLTFPLFVDSHRSTEVLQPDSDEPLTCISVVPSPAVRRLLPAEGSQYARVGGILWEHIGDRKFRGTVSILYEVNGGPLRFIPNFRQDVDWCNVPGEGTVCLW
jgi:CRISPR-associated protein Cas5h